MKQKVKTGNKEKIRKKCASLKSGRILKYDTAYAPGGVFIAGTQLWFAAAAPGFPEAAP